MTSSPQAGFWAPPLRTIDGLGLDTPGPSRPGVRRRWFHQPLVRLLAVLGLMVALALMGGAAVYAAGGSIGGPSAGVTGPLLQIATGVVGYLLLVTLLEGRRPPLELSVRRLPGLVAGLALGTAMMLTIMGVALVAGAYRIDGVNWAYQWLVPLVEVGVAAAIFEEILFRGVLFRLSEEVIGTWGAAALSGLVFGLGHVANPQGSWAGAIAIVIEAGALFGLLYAATRSLWPCIGLHFAWNVVQGSVLGVTVSGATSGGWLRSVPVGPDWLTGGQFGLEASLVAVVLGVAVTVWLGWVVVRRNLVVAPVWTRRARIRAAAAASASGSGTPVDMPTFQPSSVTGASGSRLWSCGRWPQPPRPTPPIQ